MAESRSRPPDAARPHPPHLRRPTIALADLLLNNRYELQQPLGHGELTRVYLARDRFLARQVAVKLLHPGLSADKRFTARFRREAEAAARMTHPHIVAVYDVGSDGDLNYIITEYVQGSDLKDLLIQSGPLPARRAADVGSQVASALEYAHARGLVHGNLKPHNILVAPSGLVKVSDFGVARLIHDAGTANGQDAIGHGHYTAPEQPGKNGASALADQYALGVVLYEALCGFLPFPGDEEAPETHGKGRGRTVPPSTLHTDVPPALDPLVMRALEADPRRRWTSTEELGRALREWEQGAYVPASPAEPAPGKPKRRRRRASASTPAPAKRSSRGCLTRAVGLLTLVAILGIIPISLWVLDSPWFSSAIAPTGEGTRPIVVPATRPPAEPTIVPSG